MAVGEPVTVAYATEDGTATAEVDYQAAGGRLTFPAESTAARQIEVRLRDDRVDEEAETFAVRLSDPHGATLAAVTVEPTALKVTEGATASYQVVLGSQPTGPVSVTATAAPEAAELTVDPDPLSFMPARWSVAQEVTVSVAQDSDAVADAPVQLLLTASGGYDRAAEPTVTVTVTVTVTIVEDDAATLAVAATHASEQAGRLRFRSHPEPGQRSARDRRLRHRRARRQRHRRTGLYAGQRHAALPGAVDRGAADRGHRARRYP